MTDAGLFSWLTTAGNGDEGYAARGQSASRVACSMVSFIASTGKQ